MLGYKFFFFSKKGVLNVQTLKTADVQLFYATYKTFCL